MKGLLVLLLAGVVAEAPSCGGPCTLIYLPVCGTDGVNFQVFSNECMMNNQQCTDSKTWQKSDMRSCGITSRSIDLIDPLCAIMCPMIVVPACGYNGKDYQVFPNSCFMGMENCYWRSIGVAENVYETTSMEKCNTSTELVASRVADCPQVCPMNYEPTCGYDGNEYKVFGNTCMIKAYSCLRSESWQPVTLELCPAVDTV